MVKNVSKFHVIARILSYIFGIGLEYWLDTTFKSKTVNIQISKYLVKSFFFCNTLLDLIVLWKLAALIPKDPIYSHSPLFPNLIKNLWGEENRNSLIYLLFLLQSSCCKPFSSWRRHYTWSSPKILIKGQLSLGDYIRSVMLPLMLNGLTDSILAIIQQTKLQRMKRAAEMSWCEWKSHK